MFIKPKDILCSKISCWFWHIFSLIYKNNCLSLKLIRCDNLRLNQSGFAIEQTNDYFALVSWLYLMWITVGLQSISTTNSKSFYWLIESSACLVFFLRGNCFLSLLFWNRFFCPAKQKNFELENRQDKIHSTMYMHCSKHVYLLILIYDNCWHQLNFLVVILVIKLAIINMIHSEWKCLLKFEWN